MKAKKISFRCKNFNSKFLTAYLPTLRLIAQNYSKADIARALDVSRATVQYRVNWLISASMVEFKDKQSLVINNAQRCFYELTAKGEEALKCGKETAVKGSSLRMRNPVYLHALRIKYPILKDNPNVSFSKKVKINNWVKQYTTEKLPYGITLEKTTQHIIVHYKPKELSPTNMEGDFLSLATRGSTWVYAYLKDLGIEVDITNPTVINQHLATQTPELEGAIPKNTTFKVHLGRGAESIYPYPAEAYAEADRSREVLEIESNDLRYKRNFLLMPEYLERLNNALVPTIQDLNYNMATHVGIMKEIKEALKKLGDGK